MPKKTKLRFAARSDIGMIRKQNQDSGYADYNLCVIADGMGDYMPVAILLPVLLFRI